MQNEEGRKSIAGDGWVTGKDRASCQSGGAPALRPGAEIVETVSDFILGGSKITADGDCSHEIKRRLLLGLRATSKCPEAAAR